ncbi:hypothetical protein Y09_1333 [Brachybacterium sp. SW0106-09]|uniref:HK97-gp10 family putative phage morphogenesis protein n=1 Tax=Brachybacterium sp. SW0106-09 TaxID=1704590 RepID=UPI0006B45BEA|nr:HK97-gp10 family putative phage morphogenesis protein [Brachybacterium sp. SW0106-09]GAP78505.1 hypothetical protein Y09_1333 [Brachybacterium sp. SW0106-09]
MSGDAIRRVAADLTRQAATIQPRASQVVRKVALDTEADAKALAPVDTGNLRGSITTAVQGDGLRAAVVATASYAHWVESGTSRMAPQPFMGPATDRNAPKFREAMARLAEGD